jgi:acetolactate synthase I/II/III large subunit
MPLAFTREETTSSLMQEIYMTGAELFVQMLKDWEVPFVATLCGHGMNGIDDACRRAGMPLIDVRNEQAAGYMAEACGRLTGRPGVCAVSSGVAHVNALTGVLNAYFDGAPMILVTGCGPTETMGMGHFQDFDQVAMAATVCKYAGMVSQANHIPMILHQAYNAAISGRPGPVHITFPMDIQATEVDSACRLGFDRRPERVPASGDSALVAKAATLMGLAERPVLVAGSGVHYADASVSLCQLANEQAIPILTPIWDRGSVPDPVKEYAGVCGAATGGAELLSQADVLIVVGAACDYRVGYLRAPGLSEGAQVIRIDADPNQLQQGCSADISIFGDPASVLEQLTSACAGLDHPSHTNWLKDATGQCDAYRQRCVDSRSLSHDGTHALDIVESVASVLSDDTIIIVDGGNIGQWCHQALFDRYPGHWLTCGASGVVGYGLPAAMAARALYSDRPIILISGDGSITFTIAELETATRQHLGFTIILADDEAWGITLTGHLQAYGEGITSELGTVRFDRVAEGFGAEACRADDAQSIGPLLKRSLSNTSTPTLIHVPVVRSNPGDWR